MRITGGSLRGRTLKSLKGKGTRPTASRVREAIFNIVQARILGSRWLDLFAGTGAIGIEALSRGADHCTFVEKSPRVCPVLRENLRNLELVNKSKLVCRDAALACRQLAMEQQKFDFVYIDPPYEEIGNYKRVLGLAAGCLKPDGIMAVEHNIDLPPVTETALVEIQSRRYGDTAVTFFRNETR